MCGIWCGLSTNASCSAILKKYQKEFNYNISNRGPDFKNNASSDACNCNIIIAASVLWLQGKTISQQPIETDSSILAFNGDIFDGVDINKVKKRISGDTKLFHELLQNSSDISKTLSDLQGPYAFIYLDKQASILYFGRDLYGRRSLLIGSNESNNEIILTSVAKKLIGYKFLELPAIGMFSLNLKLQEFELVPWTFKHSNFDENLKKIEIFLGKTLKVHDTKEYVNEYAFKEPNEGDLEVLNSIRNITDFEQIVDILTTDKAWEYNINQLECLLKAAIEKRIENQPKLCRNCLIEKCEMLSSCNHSAVGVLFSGGLDCSVLALLASEFIAEGTAIDLINVSFDERNSFNSPDRITALQSWRELTALRPLHNWNFVPVDVKKEELTKEREERIADLIYPLNTILDDSLGCALWFASRGRSEDYQSPSRVLIVGMGADELFGGYSRHRKALKNDSWQGLYETLNLDWQNISVRNLARDDRVVSDHGRQLRTPYLDETVVDFLRSLQPWEKTFPLENMQGIGDKILLRSLAYKLGLREACGYRKRALQFGSRIANSKENGNDVSPRL